MRRLRVDRSEANVDLDFDLSMCAMANTMFGLRQTSLSGQAQAALHTSLPPRPNGCAFGFAGSGRVRLAGISPSQVQAREVPPRDARPHPPRNSRCATSSSSSTRRPSCPRRLPIRCCNRRGCHRSTIKRHGTRRPPPSGTMSSPAPRRMSLWRTHKSRMATRNKAARQLQQ